jgi:hypothetical protein
MVDKAEIEVILPFLCVATISAALSFLIPHSKAKGFRECLFIIKASGLIFHIIYSLKEQFYYRKISIFVKQYKIEAELVTKVLLSSKIYKKEL